MLEAPPEEVKESRFSPRLIRSLRKHLGITQKELAILTGVTVGAAHLWESGQFKPSMKKKAVMVALRKLGRREVRKLLEEKREPDGGKEGFFAQEETSKKGPWEIAFHPFMIHFNLLLEIFLPFYYFPLTLLIIHIYASSFVLRAYRQ